MLYCNGVRVCFLISTDKFKSVSKCVPTTKTTRHFNDTDKANTKLYIRCRKNLLMPRYCITLGRSKLAHSSEFQSIVIAIVIVVVLDCFQKIQSK